MNIEYFIAKKLVTSKDNKGSVSTPIIKIAIIAVAIGIAMMLISIATGVGLQQKIRQKIAAFNGHISIVNFENNLSEVSKSPISIQQKFYPTFKNVPAVTHIQGVATKAGIIRTEETFEGVILKGVGADYRWDDLREYVVEGSLPNFSTTVSSQVIMSDYLAKRLKLKVGDKFNTFFLKNNSDSPPNLRVFTLVGIYISGMQEFDETYVVGDIRHIQRLNKWSANQVGNFELYVDDFSRLDMIANDVYDAIYEDRQVEDALDVVTLREKYEFIFDWLKLFDFNILIIIGCMLLVATINMVVALLVLILERTRMIGILKSIGASNWSVRKVFLYNAFHIISRGLLWGNAIALLFLLVQYYLEPIRLDPQNYYVSVVPISFSWGLFALVNLLTVFVTLLVLLIPSYIITKITPIKAIRYQ